MIRFCAQGFLFFSILALVSVVHLLDLGNDREERVHPSRRRRRRRRRRQRFAPFARRGRGCPGRGRQQQRSEHIFLFMGKLPHKKGSASTPNMHASVAVFMGRRAVRESFTKLTTKLSKKSGYYKGKRSISPGWHEKKVGGGGRGRFVFARLEKTDVRDSGRIE